MDPRFRGGDSVPRDRDLDPEVEQRIGVSPKQVPTVVVVRNRGPLALTDPRLIPGTRD